MARLFLSCGGKNIIGIDSTASELTKQLQTEWLDLKLWHGSYEVDADDFVIYSSAAIHSPEVQQARELFETQQAIRPPFSYFEFLGEISKCFTTIAIAGTHGKSTTTALTAHALANHHTNFGLGIVWAWLADRWSANMKINESHHTDIKTLIHYIIDPKADSAEHLMKKYLFVIEACEYNYQFLTLDVDYAVITNIELDHADVYGTFENYLDTFVQFCKKVKIKILTLEETQWIDKIREEVTVSIQEIPIQQFNFLHLLGSHNHSNSSLALAICKELWESDTTIQGSLEWFTWLRRRWELLWKNDHWVSIISDYAHHPTELASTLQAVREKYPDQKITLLFQPHQARRVVEFWDEFIDILNTTSQPIIYNIYTAREHVADIEGYNIQSKYLQDEVQKISSFDELWNLFVDQCHWSYTTNIQDITTIIESEKSWVILICTAGDMDREIRKHLKLF